MVACVYSRGDISSSMVALSETGEERGLYLFCLEAHLKVLFGSLKNIKEYLPRLSCLGSFLLCRESLEAEEAPPEIQL